MGLSGISAEVKIIIKWIAASIVGLILLWFLFISLRALLQILLPPKKPAATVAFGLLPSPISPNVDLSKADVVIDTADGSLPSFPNLLEVYPIPQPSGKLNSLDIASEKARNLGVNGAPKSITPTLYQWQDAQSPNRTIAIDIVSGNYNYKYDWIADPKVVAKTFGEPVDTQAKGQAKGFFNRDLQDSDLENGDLKSVYIRISGIEKTVVSSASEANAVQVSIFREKVSGKYTVVSFDQNKALVNALVTPLGNDQQILEANFLHWLVDFKSASTYPLRSSAQAFQDLKSSKAYFVSGKLNNIDQIKVADVKLAYLETEKYTAYLQPIYIFSGDTFSGKDKANFVAYLPAVADSELTLP